ncbi:MAG: hypothetical protein V3T08_09420 [Gemmatimonadota bacterium]
MANPHFGIWGHPDDWGDTARAVSRTRLTRPALLTDASQSSNHCPQCGAVVRWELSRSGEPVAMERGAVHFCELPRALAYLDHREGMEILGRLRSVFNQRRMYGEAR